MALYDRDYSSTNDSTIKIFWNTLRGTSKIEEITREARFFGLIRERTAWVSDIDLISHIRTITLAFILVLITHFFLAPILANTCALYTILVDIAVEVFAILLASRLFESYRDYTMSVRYTIIISIILEIGLQYFYGTHNYLP